MMKRILCLCLALALLLPCIPTLAAEEYSAAVTATGVYQETEDDSTSSVFDNNVEYLKLKLQAADEGTEEALKRGAEYEEMRNLKVATLGMEYETTSFFSSYDTALEIANAIRIYMGIDPEDLDEVTGNTTQTPVETPLEESVTYVVTASVLNCRSSASQNASLVGSFSKGDELEGLTEELNGFIKVSNGKITGWCSAEYLEEKIIPEESTPQTPSYTQEDLEWLALAIYREAGCNWLSDLHQLLVGNVVLNRVASSEFPNTIKGVLTQRGQYPWASNPYSSGTPTERCYENARRLLNGERFCPSNVVFQAQFRQGSGVYLSIYDGVLKTTTYFCYR